MMNNTENDYRNAIKAKYQIEKTGDFHGFLENPSPAQLREFCLLKFDNGLNKIDEAIFRIYFKTNETDNLREAIYNYHIPKFKSVQSFLSEENKKTNIQNLNLIAVLVDFNPRPYNKFNRGAYSKESTNDIKTETGNAIGGIKSPSNLFVGNPIGVILKNPRNNLKKKFAIGIGILVVTFSVGYTTKKIILPEKQCMQWQSDHYVLVDCQNKVDVLYSSSPIIPTNEKTIELKKIIVSDTTTFFEGGKAKIWYCKVDGVPEFFDGPGFHPITGKGLRPVTDYIIGKYVK